MLLPRCWRGDPNVEIEPSLQPLTGEVLQGRGPNMEDEARVDVNALVSGMHIKTHFWMCMRVFNPLASRNRNKQMKAVYQQHEREKRKVYDQRVREVERGGVPSHPNPHCHRRNGTIRIDLLSEIGSYDCCQKRAHLYIAAIKIILWEMI